MKKLFLILFLFLALSGKAADFIIATVTVTNAPTTNGQTITVNSSVRTWTNSVFTASTQILTNATIGGSATNLFNHLGAYGVGGISVARNGTNGVKLYGYSPLTVSFSAGWGSVTYTTNVSTNNYTVTVPFSVIGSTNRHIIANLLIDDLNNYSSTNQLNQNSNITAQLVGLTNTQTIGGIKTITNGNTLFANGIISNANATNLSGLSGKITGTLTNTAGIISGGTISNANLTNISSLSGSIVGTLANASGIISGGVISNSTLTNIAGLSGTLGRLTNGTFLNPVFTNGVNYGNAFSSPGATGNFSEQFGSGAQATNDLATALGYAAFAWGTSSTAIGTGSSATNTSDTAVGQSARGWGGYSSAFGYDSQASGLRSLAVGASTMASNINSTALGYGATTTTSNQVVLGSSTVNYVYTPGRIEAVGGYTNAIIKGSNTVIGGFAFTRLNNTSLANGANAAIDIGTNASEKVYIKVSGPTAAFSLNGFANPRDGRIIYVQNSTGYALTVANDSGIEPVAAYRIYTGTGADIAYTNNPTLLTFVYDSSAARWILQTVTGTATAGLTSLPVNSSQFSSSGGLTNIKSDALVTNLNLYGITLALSNLHVYHTNFMRDGFITNNLTASNALFNGTLSGNGITNAFQFLLVPGANITFTTNNGRVTVAGGSQTPILQNVNGAGYSGTNWGRLESTNFAFGSTNGGITGRIHTQRGPTNGVMNFGINSEQSKPLWLMYDDDNGINAGFWRDTPDANIFALLVNQNGSFLIGASDDEPVPTFGIEYFRVHGDGGVTIGDGNTTQNPGFGAAHAQQGFFSSIFKTVDATEQDSESITISTGDSITTGNSGSINIGTGLVDSGTNGTVNIVALMHAPTNIAPFQVVKTNFVINQRYTNISQRAFSKASYQLNAAVGGTAVVTLVVEHGTTVTNRTTISAGPLASLTTIEQLSDFIPPNGFYYFTNETTGAGATVSIVSGTGAIQGF